MFAWAARTAANTPGIISGGLLSTSDCQVTAPASGLSVNLGTGEMIIGGNEGAVQGGYGPCRVTSTTNLSLAAANPSLPRIDLICGTVNDAGYTAPSGGVTSGQWAPIALTGTPTSGANITPGSGGYLAGAPALPGSSLALAYVLVPATATNIITADILNVATTAALNPFMLGFSPTSTSTSMTASNGQRVITTGSSAVTITLPSHAPGQAVAVMNYSTGGTTVSGTSIQGTGLSSATSFPLGTVGAQATLVDDGTSWRFLAGQQDSGWVALTTASGVSLKGTDPASARLCGDRVHLKGAFTGPTGTTSWGTLPSGMRPSLPFSNDSFVVGTGGSNALRYVGLGSDGSVVTFTGDTYLALNGSFPLS